MINLNILPNIPPAKKMGYSLNINYFNIIDVKFDIQLIQYR